MDDELIEIDPKELLDYLKWCKELIEKSGNNIFNETGD